MSYLKGAINIVQRSQCTYEEASNAGTACLPKKQQSVFDPLGSPSSGLTFGVTIYRDNQAETRYHGREGGRRRVVSDPAHHYRQQFSDANSERAGIRNGSALFLVSLFFILAPKALVDRSFSLQIARRSTRPSSSNGEPPTQGSRFSLSLSSFLSLLLSPQNG